MLGDLWHKASQRLAGKCIVRKRKHRLESVHRQKSSHKLRVNSFSSEPKDLSNVIFVSSVHLGTQMLGKRLRLLERFRFCTFVAPLIKETIVKVNEKRHTGTQVNSNDYHHHDENFKGDRQDIWKNPEMNTVTI